MCSEGRPEDLPYKPSPLQVSLLSPGKENSVVTEQAADGTQSPQGQGLHRGQRGAYASQGLLS